MNSHSRAVCAVEPLYQGRNRNVIIYHNGRYSYLSVCPSVCLFNLCYFYLSSSYVKPPAWLNRYDKLITMFFFMFLRSYILSKDSKFEPCQFEPEHTTFRSPRLPTVLNVVSGIESFPKTWIPDRGTKPRTLISQADRFNHYMASALLTCNIESHRLR